MSLLLDEETVVLEGLDFTPPCVLGDHPAQLLVSCRWCPAEVFMCKEHEKQQRAEIEGRLATRVVIVFCGMCRHVETSYDALIRVVEL